MRDEQEHKKLIEKYYPNGAILDDNHFLPEFADPGDSSEIKKQKYDKFIKKLNGDNI
jgi:hypothetical protein